ncbi:GlxA family transcriptional regulator [Motilibacter deserti]|uniref:Helix-turn-helix domain-containing protein n=1 Tax=Motilibacter deserti TaxID=2714956 RepID=A0ABX0GU75_9ACTN|nr:helix-turn-helix domain-containing protein [Motilibacter deserti]NHC13261.1 helix-turn-helix domain-containing protein [Motilibacter deserti]
MTREPHPVAVVAVDGVVAFDLGIPSQVFGAAVSAADERFYDVAVCSAGGRPVPTSAGFAAAVAYDMTAVAGASTVVVPGPAGVSAAAHGDVDPEVLDALRAAAARGARIVSICTGAFVLAAAGLLDGRPATTHWRYADRFRALYPTVRLDPDVLFVDDGDVLTSAGVAAGLDLCLHIVRADHGAEVANRSARRCVVPPLRAGGQAQFIERPLPAGDDTSLAPVRAWALEHLDTQLGLPELAARASTSVRTLTRRWRAETGQSPLQWLLAQRVQLARDLLETTDLPVEQVAQRAGLGSAASLRAHLHTALGQSPTLYRRAFRESTAPR